MTTAHMLSALADVPSLCTTVMMGMKMRSTPLFVSWRMWPCTSLAGKHTVSLVTACRPLS